MGYIVLLKISHYILSQPLGLSIFSSVQSINVHINYKTTAVGFVKVDLQSGWICKDKLKEWVGQLQEHLKKKERMTERSKIHTYLKKSMQ